MFDMSRVFNSSIFSDLSLSEELRTYDFEWFYPSQLNDKTNNHFIARGHLKAAAAEK